MMNPPSSSSSNDTNVNVQRTKTKILTDQDNDGSVVTSNLVVDKEKSKAFDVRRTLGNGSIALSDCVNNNIIVARYTVLTAISMLTVYGITQTPLFYRCSTIRDISKQDFFQRRCLHGRILLNTTNSHTDTTIRFAIRHMSPLECFMSTSLWKQYIRFHPAAASIVQRKNGSSFETAAKELIQVHLAGVNIPTVPIETNNSNIIGTADGSTGLLDKIAVNRVDHKDMHSIHAELQRLATSQTVVKVQFLGRLQHRQHSVSKSPSSDYRKCQKRPIQPTQVFHQDSDDVDDINKSTNTEDSRAERNIENTSDSTDIDENDIAVVKLSYRPSTFQFFRNDMATVLTKDGFVVSNEDGLYNYSTTSVGGGDEGNAATIKSSLQKQKLVDATTNAEHILEDVRYMEQLMGAEYSAAKHFNGIWSNAAYREQRDDVITEIDFQVHAKWYQRVWRWIRGG